MSTNMDIGAKELAWVASTDPGEGKDVDHEALKKLVEKKAR